MTDRSSTSLILALTLFSIVAGCGAPPTGGGVEPALAHGVTFGGSDLDRVTTLAQDALGDVFVAGRAAFSPAETSKAFVARYSKNAELQWRQLLNDSEALGLTLQPSGGVLVVCSQRLVSLTADGTLRWETPFTGGARATSVAPATDGGAYVLGEVLERGSFGSVEVSVGSLSVSEVALVKLDAAGTVEWTRTFGGEGESRAGSLALDSDGEPVFSMANFGAPRTVPNGITYPSGASVLKVDARGVFRWLAALGNVVDSIFLPVSTDAAGHIFVAARARTSCEGDCTQEPMSMKLVALDARGRELGAREVKSSLGLVYASALVADDRGAVWVVGRGWGQVDDGTASRELGDGSGFLLGLDAALVVSSTRVFGAALSPQAVSRRGDQVAIAGTLFSPAQVEGVMLVPPAREGDAFVITLDEATARR